MSNHICFDDEDEIIYCRVTKMTLPAALSHTDLPDEYIEAQAYPTRGMTTWSSPWHATSTRWVTVTCSLKRGQSMAQQDGERS